jgi:hypothetical protein
MLRSPALLGIASALALLPAALEPGDDGKEPWRTEFQRGVALGMHSKVRGFDYLPSLREIKDLGANWVSLNFHALLDSAEGTAIDRASERTPPDEDLVATIRAAKREGLRVMLFPVVLIRDPDPEDWRGSLRPRDLGAWFAAYREFLLHYAGIAAAEDVEALSVGSEFCSLERHTEEWRRLVADVRSAFDGLLTYSANWDHYDVPKFWDVLDVVGMSTYHRLTRSKEPSFFELVESWRKIRDRIAEWARLKGKRVLFTELGYPSLDGANEKPWNYLMANSIDLAEQADCYRAFANVWRGEPFLQGVYFYEWWGEGGVLDRSYTPRGKPAETVLRDYFRKIAGEGADR